MRQGTACTTARSRRSSTCCLSSPCLAAFFSIVPERSTLESFVPEAEDEIRSWREGLNWRHRDLNLVLLLQQSTSLQLLSDLRRDTTLCRKFPLVPSDPVDLRRQLGYLPFSPLDTGEALSLRVLSHDPQLLLRRSGASPDFAMALVAQRPGAKKIARRVIEPDYVIIDKDGPPQRLVARSRQSYSKTLTTLSMMSRWMVFHSPASVVSAGRCSFCSGARLRCSMALTAQANLPVATQSNGRLSAVLSGPKSRMTMPDREKQSALSSIFSPKLIMPPWNSYLTAWALAWLAVSIRILNRL